MKREYTKAEAKLITINVRENIASSGEDNSWVLVNMNTGEWYDYDPATVPSKPDGISLVEWLEKLFGKKNN